MKLAAAARLLVAIMIAATFTCIALSQGRGGGGAGGARGGGVGGQRGPAPPRGPAPARGARGNRGDASGERPRIKETLEPDSGLVTAFVTVTGPDHRAVPGLTQKNFRVFEDGVEQDIQAFSAETGTITVGFIVGGDPSEFRGVAPAFLKATPWNDEYFVLVDDGRPPGGTVVQNFTTEIQRVPRNFFPGRITADTVYVGLDYLKEAANRRKLLLLFGGSLTVDGTPGGGLDPNYVVRMATKQGVQVHSILTTSDDGSILEDGSAAEIAALTGGRNFLTAAVSGTLEAIAEEIAAGLSVQYLLAYQTSNPERDGKWRSIKVELVDPPNNPDKLSVRTRSGYYPEKAKK